MSAQFTLAILLLGAVAIVYVWDAYTLTIGQPGHTVSAIIKEWSKEQPILAFAFGVLIGHIFW